MLVTSLGVSLGSIAGISVAGIKISALTGCSKPAKVRAVKGKGVEFKSGCTGGGVVSVTKTPSSYLGVLGLRVTFSSTLSLPSKTEWSLLRYLVESIHSHSKPPITVVLKCSANTSC